VQQCHSQFSPHYTPTFLFFSKTPSTMSVRN
jgi:hypothetical protein